MNKVTLDAAFKTIDKPWVPKIVGELNGQLVKLAKFEGEYVWHHHEHEDELFLVTHGTVEIHLRDQVVTLNPGEFYVVPRGVEHKPVAPTVAHVLLFEPATTRNTGNVDHDYTIEPEGLERL